ncbi:hypothetical protein [Candidatus Electronema sp. PJ]|uniref:hypothetical protein n=1 Tax=Candidatus Electronema sp. PJ TaxID=3401572 RepID=UPI003AA86F60
MTNTALLLRIVVQILHAVATDRCTTQFPFLENTELYCSFAKEFGLVRKEFCSAKEECCRLVKELYSATKEFGRVTKEFGLAKLLSCRLSKEFGRLQLLCKSARLLCG